MDENKIVEYEARVSIVMRKLYGISWNDAGGSAEQLLRAQDEGLEADEFVRQFGEKYDLDEIDRHW